MFDEILKHLFNEIDVTKEIDRDDLSVLLLRYNLNKDEVLKIVDFLKMYFLEATGQYDKLRVKHWFCELLRLASGNS